VGYLGPLTLSLSLSLSVRARVWLPAPPPPIIEFKKGAAPVKEDPDAPPEPIPEGTPSREEIEDRLMQEPSWMEERQLKKARPSQPHRLTQMHTHREA
jgi:hypothetical protein